ncbi:hypothetical protein UY3_00071 [Chelonia mydas]|uniref:Myb/SANT-like DNA-binding domain-containing protein n=1 Tax=Chelonia mydas TaxID=8469 RepID=M7BXL2_CHEMY|nr:hypothetical protein UY3_00071 [Chelonia mydas]
MGEKGCKRDVQQCRVTVKELRQAYQKVKKANSHSGAEPQTCHFYKELYAILSGDPMTTPQSPVDTSEKSESEAPGVNSEKVLEEEEYVENSASIQFNCPRHKYSCPCPPIIVPTHPLFPGPESRQLGLLPCSMNPKEK